MSDPLFLTSALGRPEVGSLVTLDGDDGRHAVVVRRIRAGESVLVGDGRGFGVRGVVRSVGKQDLSLEVLEQVTMPEPKRVVVAVQALAKGDRAELAVEMLTEVGVTVIIPWSASRSVVRWTGERGEKSLARWRSTAREAAKQSRRLYVPAVAEPMSSEQVALRMAEVDVALVLHEDAQTRLSALALPAAAVFMMVIGPEGGITPDELATFTAAGARSVSISDGVLRTSTAGAVAAGMLLG